MKLQAVPASEPPPAETVRQRIKRTARAPQVIECRCGSRTMQQVVTGAQLVNGKVRGGTKGLRCAACGAAVL